MTRPHTTWGPWRFRPDNLTLELEDGTYYVDLEECLSSGQTLDWLCQVAEKGWCDAEMAGHLLQAITDLLHPQANLCSWGQDKTIPRERIAAITRKNEAVERAVREGASLGDLLELHERCTREVGA
jgi:hypothetical protein